MRPDDHAPDPPTVTAEAAHPARLLAVEPDPDERPWVLVEAS
jgi:hypothetical protein